MKKFSAYSALLFALIICLGIAALPSSVAYAAEERYVYAAPADLEHNAAAGSSRVQIRDAFSGELLFYVPESYYVKVTKNNFYYEVSYMGIEDASSGFRPYIALEDVTEAALVSYDATAYPGAAPTPDVTLLTAIPVTIGETTISSADNWTIKYLGDNGDRIFIRAQLDDRTIFGLAPKTSFAAFRVPYHPIAEAERQSIINQKPSDGGNGDGTIAAPTSKTLRIILIVGIAVPAVIIIILLFRPTKDERSYDKRAMRRQSGQSRADYDRDRTYRRDYPERGYGECDYDRGYDRDYGRDYDRDAGKDRDDYRGRDYR